MYVLQVFCFSRGFPKGMLLRWFVALYEADIIDEHVFLKWKDVNDSYPGKGKALFQVNQWLPGWRRQSPRMKTRTRSKQRGGEEVV